MSASHFMAHACQQLQRFGLRGDQLPQWETFFTTSLRHGQRLFAREVIATVQSYLLDRLDTSGRARLRSCSGLGAGAFLLRMPSDTEGTELLDAVFVHAVRWRLGSPTCAPGLCCSRWYSKDSHRRCCGPLDHLGDHLICCNVGGYKTYLHSCVVTVLRSILRDSGASVPDREV